MTSRRDHLLPCLLGAVTVTCLLAAGPATAAGGASTSATGRATQAVTLLTGDRVILEPSEGMPSVTVEPRPGGHSGGFSVLRDHGDVRVIPNDVQDLVPRVLDPDLFDVSKLVRMGFDDASTDSLPLIVKTTADVRNAAPSLGMQVTDRLQSIGADAATLDKSAAAGLGRDLASVQSAQPSAAAGALGGVSKIWLDARINAEPAAAAAGSAQQAALDPYLTHIGAPAAWAAGLDGSGVTVAVLDTGVDTGHPALAGQVADAENFSDAATTGDLNGHGTHIASLVAGTGAGSDGARQGIAPGATLLSGKVLDDRGAGRESWAIAGMEWATEHGADVVNMSFGGRAGAGDDPMVDAVESLTRQTGAMFVAPAGDIGKLGANPFTIETPGVAPSALTVSAATPTGSHLAYSSEGPTADYRLKPDVTAPGVRIMGARAGARTQDLYVPRTGSQVSSPIVAGAAALLKQQHPQWSASQVKARIVSTASSVGWYGAWTEGGGELHLQSAISQPLVSDRANLDFGYIRYPDKAARTLTVTLTNTGTQPVTVDPHGSMTSLSGERAPEDAVTADPATLTIPAGGSASTKVTLDPARLADGLWQGMVTFDAGGKTLLRLPVGGYDEPEHYDLRIDVVDRNGAPYAPPAQDIPYLDEDRITFYNADDGQFYRAPIDSSGHAAARVTPGHYSIFGQIVTPGEASGPATVTLGGVSGLDVHADTTYVLDARHGQRLEAPDIAGQQTTPVNAVTVTRMRQKAGKYPASFAEQVSFDARAVRNGTVYVEPMQPVTTGKFEASVRYHLVPVGKVAPRSPEGYELLFHEQRFGSIIAPHLSPQDVHRLAVQEQTLHPLAMTGEQSFTTGAMTTLSKLAITYREFLQFPQVRTVLTTADPAVVWHHCQEAEIDSWRGLCGPERSFAASQRYTQEFGAAVHPEVVSATRGPRWLVAVVGISDGTHRGGLLETLLDSAHLELTTAAGKPLGNSDHTAGVFRVPDGPGRFLLHQDWTFREDTLHAARSSHTVWGFSSAPGETPPLLGVGYGPGVDAGGAATALHPLPVNLSFGHLTGSDAPDQFPQVRLWWSTDDGTAWHELNVRRTAGDTAAAIVPAPALRAGESLSLRVQATDSAGNSIDQTNIGLVPVH